MTKRQIIPADLAPVVLHSRLLLRRERIPGTLARVQLLSKKPLPARQAPQARFALTHPVLVAIASGAAISLWTAVIVKDWRAVVASAVLVSCAQGYLWSPWGWLHRRERRLYDENGDRRSSTSTLD